MLFIIEVGNTKDSNRQSYTRNYIELILKKK